MQLEEREYLIELFEVYKLLFSKKQQDYFICSYYDDLSLAEISDNYNVSRAAIHNALKIMVHDLLSYEEKLKFYHKYKQRILIYNDINDETIRNKLLELERQ